MRTRTPQTVRSAKINQCLAKGGAGLGLSGLGRMSSPSGNRLPPVSLSIPLQKSQATGVTFHGRKAKNFQDEDENS